MELALNLLWLGLALLLVEFCLRSSPASRHNKLAQYLSLFLIILILLPVVSVTDDILAAQLPAETDVIFCAHCDHNRMLKNNSHPAEIALFVTAFTPFSPPRQRAGAPSGEAMPSVPSPAISSIDNRPPPAA